MGNILFPDSLKYEFQSAIDRYDVRQIVKMCKKYDINKFDYNASFMKRTPLHWAICEQEKSHEMYQIITTIATASNRLIELGDNDGNTPVHLAIYSDYFDAVKILTQLNPHSLLIKNNRGETPLFVAVQQNKLEIVKYIFDILTNSSGTMNAVHAADAVDAIDAIDMIRTERNDLVSPIHVAAEISTTNMIELLVEHNMPIINTQNSSSGFTPLFHAVKRKRLVNVRLLVRLGADLDARTHDGTGLAEFALHQLLDKRTNATRATARMMVALCYGAGTVKIDNLSYTIDEDAALKCRSIVYFEYPLVHRLLFSLSG